MSRWLLEGDQIEPVALFLLDHTRGFNHALDQRLSLVSSLGGHRFTVIRVWLLSSALN